MRVPRAPVESFSDVLRRECQLFLGRWFLLSEAYLQCKCILGEELPLGLMELEVSLWTWCRDFQLFFYLVFLRRSRQF